MLPEFTSTCHRINTYTVLKTNFGWHFLYLANCGHTSFCILGTSSHICVTWLSSKCLLSNFPSGIPRYANFFHLFGLWFITSVSEVRLFILYDPLSCSERKAWHCVMSRNLRGCCRWKYKKVVVAWKAISLKRPCIPVTHNFSLSEDYELSFMQGHTFMCQTCLFLWLYVVYYSTNTPFPDIRISGCGYGYRSSDINGGCGKPYRS